MGRKSLVVAPRSRLEAVLRAGDVPVSSLAAELGIQYASVWRVVAGKSQMTKLRAMRFAGALRALGLSTSWFDII